MAHWDILGMAANIAQLTGLDVIMIITLIIKCIKITRNSDECHKLEERVRNLRSLLQWPSSSELETGSPTRALLHGLDEAAGLVDTYTKSTLWWRILHGRRITNQFRHMQSNIDYSIAVVFFNLHIQGNPPRTSDVSTGVEHRYAADDLARASPHIHVINIDHQGTDKELGTVTANLACEIMSDVVIPMLLQG